jgi:hypothetical protein
MIELFFVKVGKSESKSLIADPVAPRGREKLSAHNSGRMADNRGWAGRAAIAVPGVVLGRVTSLTRP